jgi:hypothetical protein
VWNEERDDLKASLLAVIGVVTLAAAAISRRYRREMDWAVARLAELDRRHVSTDWGPVESDDRGQQGITSSATGPTGATRPIVLAPARVVSLIPA